MAAIVSPHRAVSRRRVEPAALEMRLPAPLNGASSTSHRNHRNRRVVDRSLPNADGGGHSTFSQTEFQRRLPRLRAFNRRALPCGGPVCRLISAGAQEIPLFNCGLGKILPVRAAYRLYSSPNSASIIASSFGTRTNHSNRTATSPLHPATAFGRRTG